MLTLDKFSDKISRERIIPHLIFKLPAIKSLTSSRASLSRISYTIYFSSGLSKTQSLATNKVCTRFWLSSLGSPTRKISSPRILKGKRILIILNFRDLYDYINDEKFAEHDIYTLFNKILSLNVKDMYSKNPIPNPVNITTSSLISLEEEKGR
jgi:hypothetical protein